MSIERKKIDDLAMQAGGYFSLPSEDSMAYTELLFDICQQFGIHYYTATPNAYAALQNQLDRRN